MYVRFTFLIFGRGNPQSGKKWKELRTKRIYKLNLKKKYQTRKDVEFNFPYEHVPPLVPSNDAQKLFTITLLPELFSTGGDSHGLDVSHGFFQISDQTIFTKITITMVKMVKIQKFAPIVVCARVPAVHTQNEPARPSPTVTLFDGLFLRKFRR